MRAGDHRSVDGLWVKRERAEWFAIQLALPYDAKWSCHAPIHQGIQANAMHSLRFILAHKKQRSVGILAGGNRRACL